MGAAVGAAALQAVQAGAQMALEFGVNGVKAFIADDAAAAKLARTLQNLGLESATAAVEANIDVLQRQTGIVDDILRPSFDRLVRSVGNVEEANRLLALSTDIAGGTGRSLESVVQALGKAFDGNTGGLSRLGAGLDKATLKTGDMDLITAKLAQTFGGQAATKGATFQGQIDRLSVAFGELQESFGRGFMAGVVSGFNDGRNAGDLLSQSLKDLEPAFFELGKTIGGAVQFVPQFVAGFKVIINAATLTRETLISAVKGFIALGQAVSGDFEGAAATARDALDRIKVSGDAVVVAFGELTTTSFAPLRSQLSGTVSSALAAGNALGGSGGGAGGGGSSLASGASAAAEKTVVLTEKQQNLALRMAGSQIAVKQVTDELAALTKASNDYAASITGAIKGTVDLSAAFTAAQKASQEGTLAAGESVVSTTIANFQAQILAAKAFADSLTAIEGAGGSQALIDQILKVASTDGPGAGAFLANSLIAEGVVPELTSQLTAFDVFATGAGTALADKFYSQGIVSADRLLNGLSAEVAAQKKMLERLGQNIGQPVAVAIAEEIAQAIRDGIADGRVIAARRRAEATAAASFVALSSFPATAAAAAPFSGGGMVNIPGLAAGGPVMAGRSYLVGERGPELFVSGSNGSIVPNNAMGGNSYQITVQAGVGDPRSIGQQVVEYIKRFEQASGPVFVAA
jgi:hypothetical protein